MVKGLYSCRLEFLDGPHAVEACISARSMRPSLEQARLRANLCHPEGIFRWANWSLISERRVLRKSSLQLQGKAEWWPAGMQGPRGCARMGAFTSRGDWPVTPGKAKGWCSVLDLNQ